MKVLDSRDAHALGKVVTLTDFTAIEKWNDEFDSGDTVMCLQLDNAFVPCVSAKSKDYDYVLCGTYKTMRGFDNWRKRFYPHAIYTQVD